MTASRDPDNMTVSPNQEAVFQLTKFSNALFESTSELQEFPEGELRMYNIPSLVYSELRAMSENLALRTNVRFTRKLYCLKFSLEATSARSGENMSLSRGTFGMTKLISRLSCRRQKISLLKF